MKSEIKTNMDGLKAGMYVSRLDIPWIETSFLLEGLLISSDDDIKKLAELCKYVYVDIDRGDSPHPDFIIENSDADNRKQEGKTSSKQKINPENRVNSINNDDTSNHKVNKTSKSPRTAKSPESSEPSKQYKQSSSLPSLDKKQSAKRQPRRKPAQKDNEQNLSEFNGYLETVSTRRKRTYKEKTTFTVELKTATTIHVKLSDDFKRILSDLNKGKDLDLYSVAEGITDLTDSIIRNPAAMTWVAQVKRLDEYSYSRALGSSVWCASFGRHLGLEKSAIETLSLGGLLLDIGKSKLPGEFLTLTREISPAELRVMQKHVQFGMKIISEANKGSVDRQKYNNIKQMIAEHHERSDGSGYPNAVENKDISFFGQMAGIVDSFDAMTSERPYMSSEPLSPNNAVNELYSLRGSKFQAELIEQFIQTVGIYPTGSLVELNTGAVGVVVSINNLRRLRPTIMLILDENKESLPVLKELNLDKVSNDTAIANGLASGAYDIDIAELFL